MTEALLKTGEHTITAITRTDSKSTFPDDVQIRKVDYDNHATIVEALRGQDALIITMGVMAPKDQEPKLVAAAAEAKVPWVFPNEWGFDSDDTEACNDTFSGGVKEKIRALVESLGESSWVALSTGFWYEWSLALPLAFGFDFDNYVVTLYDDGETLISTSTWPQVGRAVASILSLKIHKDGKNDTSLCLDDFKNSHIYTNSFTVSQKDILESVLRVTQTTVSDWTVTKEPSKSRYVAGMEEIRKGNQAAFPKLLYARVLYPNGNANFEKTKGLQNKALGLPKEDIDDATKAAIQRAKQLK